MINKDILRTRETGVRTATERTEDRDRKVYQEVMATLNAVRSELGHKVLDRLRGRDVENNVLNPEVRLVVNSRLGFLASPDTGAFVLLPSRQSVRDKEWSCKTTRSISKMMQEICALPDTKLYAFEAGDVHQGDTSIDDFAVTQADLFRYTATPQQSYEEAAEGPDRSIRLSKKDVLKPKNPNPSRITGSNVDGEDYTGVQVATPNSIALPEIEAVLLDSRFAYNANRIGKWIDRSPDLRTLNVENFTFAGAHDETSLASHAARSVEGIFPHRKVEYFSHPESWEKILTEALQGKKRAKSATYDGFLPEKFRGDYDVLFANSDVVIVHKRWGAVDELFVIRETETFRGEKSSFIYKKILNTPDAAEDIDGWLF